MDIKNIVNKLIENVADSKMGAGDILRNAKILAYNIDNRDFKKWIDKESNGYSDNETLPEYRIIKTVLYGKIEQIKGFGSSVFYERFLLPTSHLSKEQQDIINTWRCINPIGEVQSIVDNAGEKSLGTPCPINVIPLIRKTMYPNVNINQVWREIQKYDLENIIESVKNRLLDFLLELDKEMNLDANFIPHNNDMRTQRIFQSTINASVANFGDNSSIEITKSSISINSSVNEEIISKLNEIISKIEKVNCSNDAEIKELIQEVNKELNGNRDKSKLKLFFQALYGVATGVSANLITPLAQQALALLA